MRIRILILAMVVGVMTAGPASAQPAGFMEEIVVTGLDLPVGLAFLPDGRMVIWDKRGRVRLAHNGVVQNPPLLDLSQEVNTYWTRGMTGLAIDPDFQSNGYVYLLYTVDWQWYLTDGNPNPALLDSNHDTFGRLVRYTLDPDDNFSSIVPDSRWVMIGTDHTNGFAVTFASHTQNTIVFAPDGTMLLSVGDGAGMLGTDVGNARNACCSSNTAEIDGILPVKERIGAFRAQLVDSLGGKILRIDPETAEGVESNPWYDATAPSAPRSRVWTLGLRNPYAFAVRPGTGSTDPADGDPGVLMIGDVGWDAWERLCVATQAGDNFGWPLYEGIEESGGYPDANVFNRDAPNPLFDGGACNEPFFRFSDLLIQQTLNEGSWPNPCDPAQQIPAELRFMQRSASLIWRNSRLFPSPLSMVPYFDILGNLHAVSITSALTDVEGPHLRGVATVGGLFYTGNKFPAEYKGAFFFAEAGSGDSQVGWIHTAKFDPVTHDLLEAAEFRETGTISPTFIAIDPEGYGLYYANHRPNGQGQIRRVTYDCNGNGIADDVDVLAGASNDVNGNGRPDECDPEGDVTGDDLVTIDDLLLVLLQWGPCDGGVPCTGDANADGLVNVDDLLLVILNLGD
ncbi:MAG: PQQ-dependent sugar dehydrogenase [Planctomycetota bacterium]|jgi:glucose/arabinose dehydrogenase